VTALPFLLLRMLLLPSAAATFAPLLPSLPPLLLLRALPRAPVSPFPVLLRKLRLGLALLIPSLLKVAELPAAALRFEPTALPLLLALGAPELDLLLTSSPATPTRTSGVDD
jgi:hypothetical protein